MKIVIFLGPSLNTEIAKTILPNADYKPPAERGDITKAVESGFNVIGLVDGVFFENCSVGHKEILNAIKSGVEVIGSSSMGSLRACETDIFGMVGIGSVYEMYKSGEIESDDEVAVVCDPISNEPMSVPLVNIRKTFELAKIKNIIRPDVEKQLISIAKEIYYPERTYDYILEIAEDKKIIDSESMKKLEKIVENEPVDVKKDDAVELLKYIKSKYT
ncbi:MAG: TfuA-related McrA-glycine thioamidation protein [Methanosarcinaceae archaeon]|nr:TfuA-related McrA-glycine thioamidation protein [Methanosarcinaceae archaeon]